MSDTLRQDIFFKIAKDNSDLISDYLFNHAEAGTLSMFNQLIEYKAENAPTDKSRIKR